MKSDWTAETMEQLLEMWAANLSSGEIAKVLGRTRNSVLGKLFRLGLCVKKIRPPKEPGVEKPRKAKTVIGGFAFGRPVRLSLEPTPREPPTTASVHILDLKPSHCRYPAGHGPDGLMQYCGAPAAAVSYCWYHAGLCFNPRSS